MRRSRGPVRAGIVVAGLSLALSACGGGGASGAPDAASEEDFCDAYSSLFEDILADVAQEGSEEEQATQIVAGLKEWSASLTEVGTPEDIPDEARDGFELSMQSIEDLDDDSTPEDFDALTGDFSEEDQAAGDAFDAYATETCGSLLGGDGVPSEE